MSRSGILWNEIFLKHDTGRGHPERSDRLRAILDTLNDEGVLGEFENLNYEPAHLKWISKIHPDPYLSKVKEGCQSEEGALDADTRVCTESYEVARHAVGAALSTCDRVAKGELDNAFLALRPPGHHAESGRAMGFCLFNTVAIAARYLQEAYGFKKILIIDWDVHHGNGTQEIFYHDPSVFYFSAHQYPYYPGTGAKEEEGGGEGKGATLNVPLQAGARDDDYEALFDRILKPATEKFEPEFILVSAGFDAHERDPLAGMNMTAEGFGRLTAKVKSLARDFSENRMISVLEGGYDLKGLSKSVLHHVRELLV